MRGKVIPQKLYRLFRSFVMGDCLLYFIVGKFENPCYFKGLVHFAFVFDISAKHFKS